MVDYGTVLAVAGVGVVAFDVYAYYQYKHALDVVEERSAAPANECVVEEKSARLEDEAEASVFDEHPIEEEVVGEIGDAPEAVKLEAFQPSVDEQLVELAERQARLEESLNGIRKDLKHFLAKPKKKARAKAKKQ
jgi:hypothetical protein